ncbi:MAG: 16S rRNA (adenine(1518)-N(6)/adenine(1519)-N(6))-dimethyltransferase RsmA [Gammaproteobacteria bacterium]
MGETPAHRARKRFGQNFLHDQAIIEKIVAAISPAKDDRIIEIGPGKGALTEPLLEKVKQLDVVEIDRDLANLLESLFTNHQSPLTNDKPKFTLHQLDALKLDLSGFACNQLRIVGNLPYNISTPLLFHLLSQANYIKDMIFMLQKEVVDRMVAGPGSKTYGRLSVMLQYGCEVTSLFSVKPGSFNPAPKVDSAVVRIVPDAERMRRVKDPVLLEHIVRDAFSQRRKTIRNSLKKRVEESILAELGIDPGTRAENLSVDDYIALANRVKT